MISESILTGHMFSSNASRLITPAQSHVDDEDMRSCTGSVADSELERIQNFMPGDDDSDTRSMRSAGFLRSLDSQQAHASQTALLIMTTIEKATLERKTVVANEEAQCIME